MRKCKSYQKYQNIKMSSQASTDFQDTVGRVEHPSTLCEWWGAEQETTVGPCCRFSYHLQVASCRLEDMLVLPLGSPPRCSSRAAAAGVRSGAFPLPLRPPGMPGTLRLPPAPGNEEPQQQQQQQQQHDDAKKRSRSLLRLACVHYHTAVHTCSQPL